MLHATENRLAATAKAVAEGELPDVSLEFCSSDLAPEVPLHKSRTKAAKHTSHTDSVTAKKKRSDKLKKAAAVDRGTSCDWFALVCFNLIPFQILTVK